MVKMHPVHTPSSVCGVRKPRGPGPCPRPSCPSALVPRRIPLVLCSGALRAVPLGGGGQSASRQRNGEGPRGAAADRPPSHGRLPVPGHHKGYERARRATAPPFIRALLVPKDPVHGLLARPPPCRSPNTLLSAVNYPPTACCYPPTAVGYLATARLSVTATAVCLLFFFCCQSRPLQPQPSVATGQQTVKTPTAVSWPAAVCQLPTAAGVPNIVGDRCCKCFGKLIQFCMCSISLSEAMKKEEAGGHDSARCVALGSRFSQFSVDGQPPVTRQDNPPKTRLVQDAEGGCTVSIWGPY